MTIAFNSHTHNNFIVLSTKNALFNSVQRGNVFVDAVPRSEAKVPANFTFFGPVAAQPASTFKVLQPTNSWPM